MRGLQARLEGRRIVRAAVQPRRPALAVPAGLAARLTGARVLGFRRRGKYILMRLDGGDSVLIHLGMSGRMVLGPARPNAADAARACGAGDRRRLARRLRRSAAVRLRRPGRRPPPRTRTGCSPGSGPEPLDDAFTAAVLTAALAGKRTPIKAALLDQRIVAGPGQHLCLRGAVPRRHQPAAGSPPASQGARAARLVPQIKADADRGDRGRRLEPARLCPAGRRTRLFPARLAGLRPRGRAVRALPGRARLRRHRALRPGGAQHIPLLAAYNNDQVHALQ